ncbi:MAG: metallophosphoesterase family protein [Pseudomonadota bacterium]
MRIAVISDIHGNLEALRSVLADLERQRPDALFCLGDNVGYGPEPEAVVNLLRQRGIPSVLGNHELGLIDAQHRNWFNQTTRRSLDITAGLISPETLAYCRALPASLTAHGCRFVHGLPPESATLYVWELGDEALARIMADLPERITFVGHTHMLELVSLGADAALKHQRLSEALTPLDPALRHLVNVGSVGQPRDGDNRAKYVIYDDQRHELYLRRVGYDIARTAQAILARGFPEFNASRLW